LDIILTHKAKSETSLVKLPRCCSTRGFVAILTNELSISPWL